MNSAELLRILCKDSFTVLLNPAVKPMNHFLADELTKPSMNIINYDFCDKPGSHWVAVYTSIDGNIEYFDSYGRPPPLALTKKLNFYGDVSISSVLLQGLSAVCGQYCLIYLILRARNFSMEEILLVFLSCKTSIERDEIVNVVINHIFSRFLKSPLQVYDPKFFSVGVI